jgi:hypothetical protein
MPSDDPAGCCGSGITGVLSAGWLDQQDVDLLLGNRALLDSLGLTNS